MLLGIIADDFTGAGDIAAMLSRNGMLSEIFIGVPGDGASRAEAGVIALKSRSLERSEAVAASLRALAWLRDQGCEQFVYKYCSTFDSTPDGNIGPVAEALAEQLGASSVVVCPALPQAGRTVYRGHLFVHDRLLSESGLERHPVNPMTDSDIRRWLAQQAGGPVGHVGYDIVDRGPDAIRRALGQVEARLVVVDALNDKHLRAIAAAVAGAPLVTGAAGVASGLPDNFRSSHTLLGARAALPPLSSPAVVLSGSCSIATRRQVEQYAAGAPSRKVDLDRVLGGDREHELADLLSFATDNLMLSPLLYSTADPEEVAMQQARHGLETVADEVEALFAELAVRLHDDGVRRFVVAGGETSGAVVSALPVTCLSLGPEICPGVPALWQDGLEPIRLALKSGNFGDDTFFTRAVEALEGRG